MLKVENLKVHYPIRGGFFNTIKDHVYAVDGVDIEIEAGKTYGLIGESGSGKTTVGKVVLGLEKATDGQIIYKEEDVTKKAARKKIKYNRDVQMIFQDAMSSLNPKKRIIDIIAEPISNFENLSEEDTKKRVLELLNIVGMGEEAMYKYPFEFSGGQRQRIGVARAIACNPRLIVADEPVSALDLSVQAQVLNFMKKIQKDFNISYLFISHDLGVVKHMCDYIYIMYRGRIVERGTREDIYNNPQHIYTKRLIAAIPSTNLDKAKEVKEVRQAVEEEYQKHLNNKTLTEILNYEPVKEGSTFFINTGKVHAIGAGTLLAEIQQTSDITYRVYDFDRKDKNGNLRELHTELALDAIDYEKKDDFKVSYSKNENQINKMVSCPYFITNYIKLTENFTIAHTQDSFYIYMCVKGEGQIFSKDSILDIRKGETVLVPACCKNIELKTKGIELLQVHL